MIQVDRTLLYILLSVVGALCAGAIVIGALTLHNQDAIKANEHAVCLSRHSATIVSNRRAELVNLIEEAVIAASRKGEVVPRYHVPPQIVELEKLGYTHSIPVPKC